MASRTGKRVLDVGDQAPEFKLPGLDGQVHSLGEFLSAGPTLVALFKVSCPTCQFTFPFLQRLEGGELQVVGISQDEAEWTQEFNAEFGVSFPVMLDDEAKGYPVSDSFGITHVPSLFVVQPDRKISWSGVGFSRRAMQELGEMAGVAVLGGEEYVPEWKSG